MDAHRNIEFGFAGRSADGMDFEVTKSIAKELAQESIVLQKQAVSGAEGRAAIVLPEAAAADFMDAWLELAQARKSEDDQHDFSPDVLLSGIQVRCTASAFPQLCASVAPTQSAPVGRGTAAIQVCTWST